MNHWLSSTARSPKFPWGQWVLTLFLVLGSTVIEAQVRPQARPQVRPQARPQVRPQARPQVRPQARPQVRPQARPQVRPQARPQVRPQARPQVRPQTRPQVRPQTRPQVRPQTRPQVRPQARPQINPPVRTTIRKPSISKPTTRRPITRNPEILRPDRAREGTRFSPRQDVIRPSSQGGRSTSRMISAYKPEKVPSSLPTQKLPALAQQQNQGRNVFSDERGSSIGTPTQDMMRRLERRGTSELSRSGVSVRRNNSLLRSSSAVRISPSGTVHLPTTSVYPPVPSTGIVLGTGYPGCSPIPWYCSPGPTYGAYYSSGLFWTGYGAGVWCSPWYYQSPLAWCHGWSLPWAYQSGYSYYWWHHGYWRNDSQRVCWISTYDPFPQSEIIFVETPAEPEEEAWGSLDQVRTLTCDAWGALRSDQPEKALQYLNTVLALDPEQGIPLFLRGVSQLRIGALSAASLDFERALSLEPGIFALRWDDIAYLGESSGEFLQKLWLLLEDDPDQEDVVTLIAALSLFSEDIPLAPARGALSEVLLMGNQSPLTRELHEVLRGDRLAISTTVTLWLEDPSCTGLLEAIPSP